MIRINGKETFINCWDNDADTPSIDELKKLFYEYGFDIFSYEIEAYYNVDDSTIPTTVSTHKVSYFADFIDVLSKFINDNSFKVTYDAIFVKDKRDKNYKVEITRSD